MGYYTSHELEVIEGDNSLIGEFINTCEEAEYALEENGDSAQSCKWYSHEQDMKSFSLKHPEVLFMLRGEGEENGDAWKEYYRNGKIQVCKAVLAFPEFNESLLS